MLGRSMTFMLVLVATPAFATSYLSGHVLVDTISGKTYTWYDGTTSTYGSDGSYVFKGGTVLQGAWKVDGDRVCVAFSSGKTECAKYFYKDGDLYVLTAARKRLKALNKN